MNTGVDDEAGWRSSRALPVAGMNASSETTNLKYRRIVAKLGTNLLTGGGDRLDPTIMAALVDQVAGLRRLGAQVLIVTSGAIAAGQEALETGRAHG